MKDSKRGWASEVCGSGSTANYVQLHQKNSCCCSPPGLQLSRIITVLSGYVNGNNTRFGRWGRDAGCRGDSERSRGGTVDQHTVFS